MQKDFHYCMIKVLSRIANFTEDEAQIIAYASQYVDDAVEHKKIKIKNVPSDIVYPRYQDDLFDPICTAHKGIQYLTGLDKDVQRKVYIPFHFVPIKKFDGKDKWNYVYTTSPGNAFAHELMDNAAAELKNVKKEDKRKREQKLVKLGIALHTFADTWAHQKFSGRNSPRDNDIERIHLLKDGKWEQLPLLDRLKLNVLPDVGHAEALDFPDLTHLTWKYEHDYSGIEINRDNTNIFLDAAQTIFLLLCDITGESPNWKKYVGNIKECLAYPTESMKHKFEKYQETFSIYDIHFDYDEDEWKKAALDGGFFNWRELDAREYGELNFKFNKDRKWFYFHMEAFEQRKFVKGNIPQ